MSNKAIFLDRDGVLNRERGEYTYTINDFEWVDDTFEALRVLQKKGFIFIIISNQGGVSKGIYSKDDVLEIDRYIKMQLKEEGIYISDSYYCPHHSELENCLCRKPKSLMLEKAIARFNIDPQKSFFIGDSARDMIAGQNLNIKGIKSQSNSSLLKAVKDILNE